MATRLVDLMGAYSKQANWAFELKGLAQTHGEPAREQPASRRVARRLREDEVGELIRGYREGAAVYELAERFTIHRTTVSGHLRRAGVPMRGQGLDEIQVGHAVLLHRQGWTVVQIGDHFGVDHRTVLSAIRARGVPVLDGRIRRR